MSSRFAYECLRPTKFGCTNRLVRAEPESEIVATVATPVEGSPQLPCLRSPDPNDSGELTALLVVDRELIPAQTIETLCHVGEHLGVESVVLLRCHLEQPIESESILNGHEVHEVTGLGSPEYGQYLVHRQLLGGEEGEARTLVDGEAPSVTPQVDLGPVIVGGDQVRLAA